MKNASPDGLFGKHELGMAAVAIVKACELAGTWDICFRIPDETKPSLRLGFTHLIYRQYLYPVPCLGAFWTVSKDFVAYMAGRHELPDHLSADHSLASHERPTFYPPEGELLDG